MFCKKCGKIIPNDSIFCSYCGETVAAEDLPNKPENLDEMDNETAIYGRCKQCGNSLQSDDGTLCEDCVAKLVNRNTPKLGYPFGSCGRCANPLEQDDIKGVCKNCLLDLQHEEKKVSRLAEPRQYDDALENNSNKGHGCLIAFLICVVIGIIFALSIATPHATTVENNVVPSDVQEESSAVLSSALPPSSVAIVNPPEMSLEEYYKIKNGMTYDQVTAIIGSYGVEQARSGSGAYEMVIVSWVGNGFLGSNANITFQGGRVEAKGQIGLQ